MHEFVMHSMVKQSLNQTHGQ